MPEIGKLNEVLTHVKNTFVGKDEIVDLLGISLVARENTFLLGPPGTAKSAIIRKLASCITGGKNFEYLLTRFTEPNEIFGPFDIRRLKEGELVTNTEGMMPEASMVFLDEIFNANSAILNSLLLALNEKIFRRGKEVRPLPALMFVGASNVLPEDEALAALLDRFLIRVRCDYVETDLLEHVLTAGRKLERLEEETVPTIESNEVEVLQQACKRIDLSKVQSAYVNLILAMRNAGVKVSDRRAVKVQNLVASSALICGRKEAHVSDLWVLKYVWDTEEQIEVISGIVDNIINENVIPGSHPRVQENSVPNAEELAQDVEQLAKKWASEELTEAERNVIKDKLRFLQNRSGWIQNGNHREELEHKIGELWRNMLQTT